MKYQFLIIALFLSLVTFAQTKGTISGVISDKDLNNEPLAFASVSLKGTTVGVTTDLEGKYNITADAGTYTLVISFVGYETAEIPFVIKANEKLEINRTIGSGSVNLEDIVLTSNTNRQKETALLMDQKNAVEIKQNIGAQELSRKGVGDVATAVTKTSGITKQEGSGNIFVRGLGDRYNSTTLNGLPVPSNDPEKKNLNLEIFSTDIVEYISIDKVYNSRLFGDYAGGNVDIVSKEHKGKSFLKIDIGSNINSNAIGESNFQLQKGYSSLGFDKVNIPSNSLTQYNFNTLQLSDRNPIGTSFGISGGRSFDVGEQGKLSIFGTINQSTGYSSITDGVVRTVNGAGVYAKNFESYTRMSYNTNLNGMVNVAYKMNPNNKLNFNSLFINTTSLSKRDYSGYFVDGGDDGNGFIRRNMFDKNTLWINQLLGDHKLTERSKFNWGVSYNTIVGDQPDRTQNILNKYPAGYTLLSQSTANNHRYFQELTETEVAANLSVDYKFLKDSDDNYKGKFTLGYSARIKKREFEATQFNFKSGNAHLGTLVDVDNLDAFFNQSNYANNVFSISTFRGDATTPGALTPQFYNGNLFVNGLHLTTEYKSGKLTTSLGLRGEYLLQKTDWNTSLDPSGGKSELDKMAFLPSLTMKYELNDKQNLRFGFSKTYTFPQFKETVPFVYEEVDETKYGNRDLYESDDYNFDIKWEMFPKSEEVISVTGFGKYIQNPINEITILSSTNDVSFVNTGDYAYIVGAEIEYRKLLFSIDEGNTKKLSAGLNASYLYSNQELNAEKVAKETNFNVAFTETESKLTGASDLLLNADISYFTEWNEKESNLTSTIAFTQFSDRVYALGTNSRGNQVDKAFGSLDFITKMKINKNFGIGLVAKNLLDPAIRRVQENPNGDVTVLSYKKGVTVSLGLNYQF